MLIVSLVSCKKDMQLTNINSQTNDDRKLTKIEATSIKDFISKSPIYIRFKDSNNRNVEFDVRNGTYDYSKNWSFATPSSSQIVFSNNSVIIYLSSPSGISPAQTYTVNAGNTSLNVNTFCLAAQTTISTPFSLPTNGISFVLGVDGSAGLFGGIAMYIVYDSPASGNYNIINWQNYPNISNGAVAFVFSYNSSQVDYYLSQSGTMNVNNGDMTFNGDYYYLQSVYSAITQGVNYTIVPGSGTMGCQ